MTYYVKVINKSSGMLVIHLCMWAAEAHPRGHHCHQTASYCLQSGGETKIPAVYLSLFPLCQYQDLLWK